jgi:magnesium transporter
LKVASGDVQSLNEYEVHLTDKLQFLLDADLGFIATEQNDLFKVMTICIGGRHPAGDCAPASTG